MAQASGHLRSDGSSKGVSHDSWGDGPQTTEVSKVTYFVGCDREKMNTRSFKPINKSHLSCSRIDLIHTDVCGAIEIPSLGKSKYFVTFIDDYTRMTFVYFLKRKSKVDSQIINSIKLVER